MQRKEAGAEGGVHAERDAHAEHGGPELGVAGEGAEAGKEGDVAGEGGGGGGGGGGAAGEVEEDADESGGAHGEICVVNGCDSRIDLFVFSNLDSRWTHPKPR